MSDDEAMTRVPFASNDAPKFINSHNNKIKGNLRSVAFYCG
jgi:hypothetical protein